MESMNDYQKELEASFRRIKEGDILSGTVIGISEEEIILDLKYYAQGIIKVADFSEDPDFNVFTSVHEGDTLEATVVRMTVREVYCSPAKKPMKFWHGIN